MSYMTNFNKKQWEAALEMLNASTQLESATEAAIEYLWRESDSGEPATRGLIRSYLKSALERVQKARKPLNDMCGDAVRAGTVKDES